MQNYQKKNEEIDRQFQELKSNNPGQFQASLNLSWSNWGFGMESLETSLQRLADNNIPYIELHGNRYGEDLGYRKDDFRVIEDFGIRVGGICGMFSADCSLASNRPHVQQRAIDYIRRQLDMAVEAGGDYLLVVPGAVGKPDADDKYEFYRSAEALRLVADDFAKAGVKCAVEPIRSAEVSFCNTVKDAKAYIEQVNHPAIQHINGDVYHMWTEEDHTGMAIIEAGKALTNLHMADSQRGALGTGQMDLDTILKALYIINYNRAGCYFTPEPLGPGGNPYPAMYGRPDPEMLDRLVKASADYFRERQNAVLEFV